LTPDFLNRTAAPTAGAVALATFNPRGLDRLFAATRDAAAVPVDDLARDERTGARFSRPSRSTAR